MKKRGRTPVPVEVRLDAKTDKKGPDECWNWQGAVNSEGYGYLWVDGKSLRVTRLVLERRIGRKLKEGEQALHLCNNPLCCNPNHLSVGTCKENMEYMVLCNRQAKGEKNGNAKHTDAEVKEIIRLLAEGHPSQAQICRMMGVTKWMVYSINTNKRWRHISPEIPRPIRRRGAA